MSEISFTLMGAPPSWSNRRGHWRAEYEAKKTWRELSWFHAAAARVLCEDLSMRIIPDAKSAPEKRDVEVAVSRCQLLDPDNLVASVKPVVDGLKKQVIVDDSSEWMHLTVTQTKVSSRKLERTEIRITRSAESPVHSRAAQRSSVVQGGSG